jgi:hypothetical protein
MWTDHASASSPQRAPGLRPANAIRHRSAEASIRSDTSPDRSPRTCVSYSARARSDSWADRWNKATCHQPCVTTVLRIAQAPACSDIQRTPAA